MFRLVLSVTFLCLLPLVAVAQNLVPNPSFETYNDCPLLVNQLYKLDGWTTYKGSPDAYHACTSGGVGVPSNLWGYQTAIHDSGYVGLYVMQLPWVDSREMIGCQLNSPLQVGTAYHVSMKISRADNATVNVACSGIGLRFLENSHSFTNPVPLDNFAHLKSDSILTDTSDWFTIQDVFIPDTAFEYLSIGNFFTDDNSDTIVTHNGTGVSYYLVDDVVVVPAFQLKTENQKTRELMVYPNPTSFEFRLNNNSDGTVILFDTSGRLVLSSAISTNEAVDISSLRAGSYILQFKPANGVPVNTKLLIK